MPATPAANTESIWIPPWMQAPGFSSAPSQQASPEEWAEWRAKEAERRRPQIEKDKETCKMIALAMQVIPFYGQLAAGPFYAVCIANAEKGISPDDKVFGPVKQDPAMLAEAQRGAPKVPTWHIIDATPEQKRADKAARERYLRDYALWKEADLRRFVPDMTRAEWDALPVSERQVRAARIQALATAAFKVHEPKWLRVVLQDRARELLGQLQEWTAPTLVQRFGGIGYVAIGVAAVVTAVAAITAALSSPRRRRETRGS